MMAPLSTSLAATSRPSDSNFRTVAARHEIRRSPSLPRSRTWHARGTVPTAAQPRATVVTGLGFAPNGCVSRLVPIVFLFGALAVAPRAGAEPAPAPVWLVAPSDPAPPPHAPTYFEEHSKRVTHDMLLFQHGYTLETMRARDQLYLYGATPGTATSTGLGIGVLSTAIISSAHAPLPLRFAFDRTLHLGPAIFDGGGMGAGFGGRIR
jgi:hypothetical protein